MSVVSTPQSFFSTLDICLHSSAVRYAMLLCAEANSTDRIDVIEPSPMRLFTKERLAYCSYFLLKKRIKTCL